MTQDEADKILVVITKVLAGHVVKELPKMVRVNAWIENNGGENLCGTCGAGKEDMGWVFTKDMEMAADDAFCDYCGEPLEQYEMALMNADYFVNQEGTKRQCVRCGRPTQTGWQKVTRAIISRNIAQCCKCGDTFEESDHA